jgi:glycosyltransferase involved in cell wall biosynthesis
MKRICFVIPTLAIGGTERQLVQLMHGLAPDFEMTVICTGQAGVLAEDVRRLGAEVYALEAGSGWNLTLSRRIQTIFRSHRPDIVHALLFGFDYPAVRAARKTGTPVVISGRRQLAHWKKPRHLRLQRRANAYVDSIVANCQAAADFAADQERADSSNYRVIHNGIEADAYLSDADPDETRQRLGIPSEREIIGIVANFSPVKDHALFLEIAGDLMSQRENLHFLMVGGGPRHKDIMRTVRHRGWADRFTRYTASDDIADLYAIMSAMVLCSKSEGSPNAVLEAMAACRPVVAANVGGVPELVDHERTGLIVDSRKPADFANALLHLLTHPEEAIAMGESAGDVVRRQFTISKMVQAHRDLYLELLARQSAWNR